MNPNTKSEETHLFLIIATYYVISIQSPGAMVTAVRARKPKLVVTLIYLQNILLLNMLL